MRHKFLSLPIALVMITASYLAPTFSQSGAFPPGGPIPMSPNASNSNVAIVGPSQVAATGTHLMSSASLSNGAQQIVLVDPARQTMVVYHIDPNKGDVQLKSVRRIDADFSLEEFNLSEPTPSTIRKNLRNP